MILVLSSCTDSRDRQPVVFVFRSSSGAVTAIGMSSCDFIVSFQYILICKLLDSSLWVIFPARVLRFGWYIARAYLRRYIDCLCVCLPYHLLPFVLIISYLFLLLSFPLRIAPLCFQAEYHRRRLNLSYNLYHFILSAVFLCLMICISLI